MSTLTTLKLSDLEIVHDEPRIADLKLAKALGYKKHYDIRPLIDRNMGALNNFGEVFRTCGKPQKEGGRPTETVHLNEKQALYIIAKSNTPTAAEMTVAMVEVFHAYRHGHLQPTQPMPATFPTTMYAKPCWRMAPRATLPQRNRWGGFWGSCQSWRKSWMIWTATCPS